MPDYRGFGKFIPNEEQRATLIKLPENYRLSFAWKVKDTGLEGAF